MKVTINTNRKPKKEKTADYRALVISKLQRAVGQDSIFRAASHDDRIDIDCWANDDWDRILAVFFLLVNRLVYNYYGKGISLQAGETWQQVWEVIEDVDFSKIEVVVQ